MSAAKSPSAAWLAISSPRLFGQWLLCCRAMAKNTYGTGCFYADEHRRNAAAVQTGAHHHHGRHPRGEPFQYVVEGSIFVAGAAVQWLRDELHLIDSAAQTEALALSVPDSGGVVLVPAFTGLGAPYWDMYARGTLLGITRGTGRAHIARATLDLIALQTYDVLDVMQKETGIELSSLRVDGGASANGFLMQTQADLLNKSVIRPKVLETTALGCCLLWQAWRQASEKSTDELREFWELDDIPLCRRFPNRYAPARSIFGTGPWSARAAGRRNKSIFPAYLSHINARKDCQLYRQLRFSVICILKKGAAFQKRSLFYARCTVNGGPVSRMMCASIYCASCSSWVTITISRPSAYLTSASIT